MPSSLLQVVYKLFTTCFKLVTTGTEQAVRTQLVDNLSTNLLQVVCTLATTPVFLRVYIRPRKTFCPRYHVSTSSHTGFYDFVSAAVCSVSYIIGLSFCTESGVYWLELFNDYSGTIPLLTIAFFELIAVAWVYGLEKYVLTDFLTVLCFTILGNQTVQFY